MMNTYSPLSSLVIFFIVCIVLFLIFHPKKGFYFNYLKGKKSTQKTAIEDILKLVYHQPKLLEKDIFNELEYSSHLLQESIKKMVHTGLLTKENLVFELTEEGREYAIRIVRAHRLWEKYLSEKTGFDKREWHGRAENKEHQLSANEVDALETLLGNPKFDPHGDPIPTKEGKVVVVKGIPLSELPRYSFGKIIHIEDEPHAVYKEILAKKIHLGSQIQVLEINEKQVVFEAEGEQFELTSLVAKNITIMPLEAVNISEENKMRLSNLKMNETATIIGISKECRGENRRRLLDLGFVKGATVAIDLLNPLKDPKAFLIKGTAIALRNDQAVKILITKNNA